MIGAGKRDRRVQFLRAALTDDGFQSRPEAMAPYGTQRWAARADLSDTEVQRSGQEVGTLMSRFIVLSCTLTRSLTPADEMTCDGRRWTILGIKETGGRAGLEITARAKVA